MRPTFSDLEESTMANFVIIGAGISGMSAAYELRE
jgi:glycine/D-amino acid oxidase-like deaminating enzyme